MGELLGIVIFVWIIYSAFKKGGNNANEQKRPQKMPTQNRMNMGQQSVLGQSMVNQNQQTRVVTAEDRARLEEYKQKKNKSNAYVPSQPVEPNQKLDVYRERVKNEPNIVERAKANSKKYATEDVTLETMEEEHQHSEKVSSAVAAYVEEERAAHRKMHEEPHPAIEETSMLGSVEDLIVKGYDGNLSFERDFLGEANDFLANLTL